MMTCDLGKARLLVFVSGDYTCALRSLENMGADMLILRRHTDIMEIDFRLSISGDFSVTLSGVSGIVSFIQVQEDFSDKDEKTLLDLAEHLISQERFWEVHNMLEEIWKRIKGRQKEIVHDLIGIIVSQIKVQMNQQQTGETVYLRNLSKLKSLCISGLVSQLPEEFTYPLELEFSSLVDLLVK